MSNNFCEDSWDCLLKMIHTLSFKVTDTLTLIVIDIHCMGFTKKASHTTLKQWFLLAKYGQTMLVWSCFRNMKHLVKSEFVHDDYIHVDITFLGMVILYSIFIQQSVK